MASFRYVFRPSQEQQRIEDEITKEEGYKEIDKTQSEDAVFVEFNPELAYEKLINLKNNPNYKERLSYVRHLTELCTIIGSKAFANFYEIISFTINDTDEIKLALMQQIKQLVVTIQDKNIEDGYQTIKLQIIPIVSHFLNLPNLDIKEECGDQLGKIAYILNDKDRGDCILTVVLKMSHDDEDENNRMVACQLLSKLAPLFGKDLCEQFVALEILSLCEDPQLRVRKEAVSQLSVIGKIVSPAFLRKKFVVSYVKLADDTFWAVRKSCVESIVEMSKISERDIRETTLTNILLKLLKDQSKWVKISAYKNLGQFIATLYQQNIREELIIQYTKMTESSINNLSSDNEIIIACAFNFPAVLYTLGPESWPFLSKTFSQLLKNNSKKVKKTLACALHQIAKIIGPQRAAKDLFGLLDTFLMDNNDDIKYGVIKNLANFLQVFDQDIRENYAEIFVNIQKDFKKWRVRELIAKQINQLSQIFSKDTTFIMILPISIKLCNDLVAIVREEASKNIYSLVLSLYDGNDIYRESLIQTINSFASSTKFTQRQAFVFMCEGLMNYKDIFEKHFLQQLLNLQNDRVPNVRIAITRMLRNHIKKSGPMKNHPDILNILNTLRPDQQKEIQEYFKEIDEFLNKPENNGVLEQEQTNIQENDSQQENDKQQEETQETKEEVKEQQEIEQQNESITEAQQNIQEEQQNQENQETEQKGNEDQQEQQIQEASEQEDKQLNEINHEEVIEKNEENQTE